MKKPCVCAELRGVMPDCRLPATDEEQVMMVIEVGLVAAMMDDEIPPAEADALAAAIRLLPGLRHITDAQVDLLLAQAGERVRLGERWFCEVACGLTHPSLRRVAFRLACMLCALDGVIDEQEQDFLSLLTKAFGLSDAQAATLFLEATGQQSAPHRRGPWPA